MENDAVAVQMKSDNKQLLPTILGFLERCLGAECVLNESFYWKITYNQFLE